MSADTKGRRLRPSNAADYLDIGVSTLWRYAKTLPDFPQPIKLSPRCTVFSQSALDAWVESRATVGQAA